VRERGGPRPAAGTDRVGATIGGALGGWLRRYALRVEWTPLRIRLFRDVGLCQSQEGFPKTLGFAERTIGNAERSTHSPSLDLRRALDQALEHASDAQRDRFLAAVTTEDQSTASPHPRHCASHLPGPEFHDRTLAPHLSRDILCRHGLP
jgi:hypothetical protein